MARDRICPGLHFLAEARYTAPARGTVVQVVSTSFLERGAAAVVEPNLALPCSETGELPVQGDANVGAPDPELTRQREGRPDLYSVVSKGPNMTLMSCPQLRAYGLPLPNLESDRQDSNPLPSEPQVGGRGSGGGPNGAPAGQRMPRRGRIALRLQYGSAGPVERAAISAPPLLAITLILSQLRRLESCRRSGSCLAASELTMGHPRPRSLAQRRDRRVPASNVRTTEEIAHLGDVPW
jgi:hypothetical protein